ncbi:hypothetical protein K3495_g2749 [Podosphaera aphanis]|nr:hypothetical protein K3495_g2749 [Podosphaera aphanis]
MNYNAKSNDLSMVILGSGVSISQWITNLQSVLVQKHCLGHVFHNIPLIKPVFSPEEPTMTTENATTLKQLHTENEEKAVKWTEGEIVAKQKVVNMISKKIRPQNFINMTAKQIFDHVSNVREEGATTPRETAIRNSLSTRFTSTANNYCNEFMQNFLDVKIVAESMMPTPPAGSKDVQYNRGDLSVGYIEADQGVRREEPAQSGRRQIAFGKDEGRSDGQGKDVVTSADPEVLCTHCYHNKHKNKNCFKQHPELRRKFRGNGLAKAASGLKDEIGEDEDSDGHLDIGTMVRAGASLKTRLLYGTDVSHHFARCKDDFVEIKKLAKPFEFDQAVGNSTLTHRATCRLRIENLSLDLKNVLYSLNSVCDIVSAVKLMRNHGIVAARRNVILVQINDQGQDMPVAKLVNIIGVFVKGMAYSNSLGADLDYVKNKLASDANGSGGYFIFRTIRHIVWVCNTVSLNVSGS